jgi:molecular chaperone DnaK
LSKDEIEKFVKDAEANASADKKKKEEIETKNVADTLCYTAEKALKDAGEKVSAEIKKEVEDKVKALRDVLLTATVEELKKKTQELSESMQKIGQSMYGQQGQPNANPEDQGPNPRNQGGPNEPGKTDQNGPVEGEVVE